MKTNHPYKDISLQGIFYYSVLAQRVQSVAVDRELYVDLKRPCMISTKQLLPERDLAQTLNSQGKRLL